MATLFLLQRLKSYFSFISVALFQTCNQSQIVIFFTKTEKNIVSRSLLSVSFLCKKIWKTANYSENIQ